MAIKITKSDVKWSYVSLFMSNGINLFILPLVLFYLTKSELGLWYTFAAIAGLTILLDFGFSMTISRNVAYLWSGGQSIDAESFDLSKSNDPNTELFSELFKAIKYIYSIIGVLVLLILFSGGTYYVSIITDSTIKLEVAIAAWLIYSLAVFFNMKYAYWNSILKGIGAIKANQQLNIITKISQLFFSFILLLFGLGLFGISLAYLLSIVINRILAPIYFKRFTSRYYEDINFNAKLDKDIVKKLVPNTLKQSMISISNYINLRSFPLLSSYFLGLQLTGVIGVLIQIITVIISVSNTYFNTYSSQFVNYRVNKEFNRLYNLFKKSIKINNLILGISFTFLLFLFNIALKFLGIDYVSLDLLFVLMVLIYFYFYNNHMLHATFIGTTNNLYYYKYFIGFAFIGFILQIIFLIIYPNIYSLVLPQLVVQAVYNNWKWPSVVKNEFNLN